MIDSHEDELDETEELEDEERPSELNDDEWFDDRFRSLGWDG